MEELKKKATLPHWMRHPVVIKNSQKCPLNSVPFLDPRLKRALRSMDITTLFPVQVAMWHETIGPGSFDRDLAINSPTGSGKTLAYALPIVQALSNRTIKCLRALVVLPTRDLAVQVKEVFSSLAGAVGLSVGLAVGQSSIADEIAELIRKPKLDYGVFHDRDDFSQELRSAVDILVATPGRLMDHINNTKGFTLEHLCYLVVDETDRLLREAYQSWLPTVLQLAYHGNENLFPSVDGISPPIFGSLKTFRSFGVERGFKGKPHPRLVKMVLSATLTQDASKLQPLDLHHPLFLSPGQSRYQLPEHLKSFKVVCEPKKKPLYLLALLESLQEEEEKCIVFTNSVESTHNLFTLLDSCDGLKIKIKEYSRLQRQSIRSKTLKEFRAGDIQVLVSSDAMTRGMDIEGVKTVINYDMPKFIKTYIHRAGRTARAGQTGRCITLLLKGQVVNFKKVLGKAGIKNCPVYPVPEVEPLRSVYGYDSAWEKMEEIIRSEKHRERKRNSSGHVAVQTEGKAV